MKALLATTAIAAVLAFAGGASAQMYQTTTTISGTPSWMMDDGSSSDYPIHNPGDISGDRLNSQYQGGIPTAPGHGFPAYPGQGE
jgi:hypothetical protein